MPIEHVGLGVPDVAAAKAYYDELMPLVGYQPCFDTGYCPDDWQGAQISLYPTREEGTYSRHRVGLQHVAFLVPTRADVHRVHDWVRSRGDRVVRAPDLLPLVRGAFLCDVLPRPARVHARSRVPEPAG